MIIKFKNKKILIAVVNVIVIIVSYILFTAFSIWNYASVDQKTKADVIIVLGAGTANGNVSAVFKERLNHGVWLYNNSYAPKIIITGGVGEGNTVSDAYTAKNYVMSCGVPESDILLEERSVITQQNLEYSKIIMDENLFKTALIVSDPLHMKRAMLMAKDYGIKAYSSPTPTTRYISLKTKVPFLLREQFFYIGYRVYRLF